MSHALTIVITRDVERRYRGLLRSAMLEVAAGVYISTNLNQKARDRLWEVLSRWRGATSNGSITMVWRDRQLPAGMGLSVLGETKRKLVELDGFLLTTLLK